MMKPYRTLLVLALASGLAFTSFTAMAKTCCEKAYDQGKECANKCCVAAHKQKKSCAKCNPGKEDLKVMEKLEAAKKKPAR